MIKENSEQFSAKMMCKLLSISLSGYYDWRRRLPSKQSQQNAILSGKIKAVFDDERGRAGAKRITKRLHLEGMQVGRHRVARIMRANGWRAKAARKFKPQQTAIINCLPHQICFNKIFLRSGQMKNGFQI